MNFDSPILTYTMYVLIGIFYFFAYYLYFYKILRWKMIHAIWIPLIFSSIVTIYVLSLLSTPWFGANRPLVSQIGVIVEVNLSAISFWMLYLIFTLGKKAKS